jgi:DNA-binding transcriptional regulator GbsR (MarR family)
MNAEAGDAGSRRARQEFVDGMGEITDFWGAGRHTGRLWGLLYLSPEAMSLGELARGAGITKGHASTNLRTLLRLRMVRRVQRPGDRRDWFEAEPDIWRVARGILRERGEQEFDRALGSTERALAELDAARASLAAADYAFLRGRIEAVRDFNATLDRAVEALLRMDDLREAARRLAVRVGSRSG